MVAGLAIVLANTGGKANAPCLWSRGFECGGVSRREVETIDPTRGHGEIVFENAPATLLGRKAMVGTITGVLSRRCRACCL